MKIPYLSSLRKIYDEFSLIEKIVFTALVVVLIVSGMTLLYFFGTSYMKDVPARGGEMHEGVVGYPHFINPLLATTESERDLSTLTYSGLMRVDATGNLVPDLAESYTVSNDGKIYTFVLRKGEVFQDNTPITSDDVIFTIQKAEDPTLKSPQHANWQGVTVNAIDARTVQFVLKTPYSSFLQNTTLGILPKHIWNDADINEFTFSSYNFNPVGSGPYQIKEVKRDSAGLPIYYRLVAFNKYPTGEKDISTIYIHTFIDQQSMIKALEKGTIGSAGGISPSNKQILDDTRFNIYSPALLRTIGVFFNQSQNPLFAHAEIRQALGMAVDRNDIIGKVLYGYGNEEFSPLPHNLLLSSGTSASSSLEAAKSLLDKNDWKSNSQGIREKKIGKQTVQLSFSITTSDNPDLLNTAALLKEEWTKLGANVTIISLDPSDLSQNAIRPRKYDALLFGEVIGRGDDLYPFWDSAERKDPGFNIALYANSKADKFLEEARSATSSDQKASELVSAENIISGDMPAIFLYSPDFIYVARKDIKGLSLPPLEMPYERWAGIFDSYINTRKVFK